MYSKISALFLFVNIISIFLTAQVTQNSNAIVTAEQSSDGALAFKQPDDGMPRIMDSDLVKIQNISDFELKNILKKDAEKNIVKYFKTLEKMDQTIVYQKQDIDLLVSNYSASIDGLKGHENFVRFYTAYNLRAFIIRSVGFLTKQYFYKKFNDLAVENDLLKASIAEVKLSIERTNEKSPVNSKTKLFSLVPPTNMYDILVIVAFLLSSISFLFIFLKK